MSSGQVSWGCGRDFRERSRPVSKVACPVSYGLVNAAQNKPLPSLILEPSQRNIHAHCVNEFGEFCGLSQSPQENVSETKATVEPSSKILGQLANQSIDFLKVANR